MNYFTGKGEYKVHNKTRNNAIIIGFVRTKVKVEQCVEILHLDQTTIVLFKNTFYEKH